MYYCSIQQENASERFRLSSKASQRSDKILEENRLEKKEVEGNQLVLIDVGVLSLETIVQ